MQQQQRYSQREYVNCPTSKDIGDHFHDQLLQLNIQPRTGEDREELMKILNVYLSYPDDKLASDHRLANKLGLMDVEASERKKIAETGGGGQTHMKETKIMKLHADTCKCCGFFIKEEDLGICSVAPSNVKTIGTSNRIFFETFCFLTILLLIMLVIYSAFAFASNVAVAKSTNYLGTQNLDYLSISLGAKSQVSTTGTNSDGEKYFLISSWLGVAMLLIWTFVFGCIRKQISMIEHQDTRRLGISDFSIVIENMPTDFTLGQIQQQFTDYLKKKKDEDIDLEVTLNNLEVVRYNEGKPFYLDQKEFTDAELTRLLKDYQTTKEHIADYVAEYRKYGRFETPRTERSYNYVKYQEVHIKKQEKYKQIVANLRKKLESKYEAHRTVVFVTFRTHEQRNFVIENNKNSLFYKLKRGIQFWKDSDYFKVKKGDTIYNDIYIQKPPEPEDIQWGNLGITDCQKFVRFCFTIFVSLIMVGISLVIVYFLSTVQSSNQNQRFISILISLAISITNLLIVKVIQFMTLFQKVYSMNNYQISIAIKSIFVQLINSIAVPIIVNYHLKNINIFGRSGLCEDIFILSLASSLVPPLVRLIDPYNILLTIRYKYYQNQERRLYLNQYELNEIGEKMEFQIGLEYIYVIHNFIFTCYFVSLQPVIPCFAIIGLFLMYWIEKYSLFSRCQRPVPGPDVITSKLYQLVFFGAVAFALGNLTWSWFLPDTGFKTALIPNLISLGLALIIFIFPYEKLVSKAAIREQKDYYQKRIYFPSEYDRLNPSTAKQGIEEYRSFLESMRARIEGGNAELQNQILMGFQSLNQNNTHKHNNILNRLSYNDSDLVVQQLLFNESRNVVNPQQLLNIIIPADHMSHSAPRSKRSDPNEYPLLERPGTNVNIGRSMIYQESSKNLITNPNHGLSVDPNAFHDDLDNIYRSNIKFADMKGNSDKKGGNGFKKVESQTFSEEKKDDKGNKKR